MGYLASMLTDFLHLKDKRGWWFASTVSPWASKLSLNLHNLLVSALLEGVSHSVCPVSCGLITQAPLQRTCQVAARHPVKLPPTTFLTTCFMWRTTQSTLLGVCTLHIIVLNMFKVLHLMFSKVAELFTLHMVCYFS